MAARTEAEASREPVRTDVVWHYIRTGIFYGFHLTVIMLAWAGFSWGGLALCLGSYFFRMFWITAGYHRYFSHRSFKTGRVMQFLMAFFAQTSLQKGALWWAAHHRHHHTHSDDEEDVHSPIQRGFWHSHVGWILSLNTEKTQKHLIKDLTKYPELVWLNKYWVVPALVYAVALFLLFGFHGLVWGFFVSTILLWHGTFLVNSVTHVIGRRVYDTPDGSRNNWWVALLTLGEGWHNNHHYYQRSTAQGWRWFELDVTYLVLKVMSWVRLVRGVTRPPVHIVKKTIRNLEARLSGPQQSAG